MSGGKAAALLLLSAWCASASAAPGLDALCPDSAEREITLDVPVSELSVETTEHAASGLPPGDALLTAAASREVAAILRRIFDETLEVELPEPGLPARSAPLAELNSQNFREGHGVPSGSGDADTDGNDETYPAPATHFPGLTDQESQRYRRQMYRTDI